MTTKPKPINVDHERLLALFRYDPHTGNFVRLVTTRGRAQAGSIAGSLHGSGYWRIYVDDRDYLAHRLAWLFMTGEDVPDGYEIDHINGDRGDNRWCNLRLATSSQNKCNSIRRGRPLPKGVSFDKATGRYIGHIRFAGTDEFLGRHDTPEDAAAAYVARAAQLHGDFMRVA